MYTAQKHERDRKRALTKITENSRTMGITSLVTTWQIFQLAAVMPKLLVIKTDATPLPLNSMHAEVQAKIKKTGYGWALSHPRRLGTFSGRLARVAHVMSLVRGWLRTWGKAFAAVGCEDPLLELISKLQGPRNAFKFDSNIPEDHLHRFIALEYHHKILFRVPWTLCTRYATPTVTNSLTCS